MYLLRSMKNTFTSFSLYFSHFIIFLKETKALSYYAVIQQLYQNTAIFTLHPQISQLIKRIIFFPIFLKKDISTQMTMMEASTSGSINSKWSLLLFLFLFKLLHASCSLFLLVAAASS